MDGADATVDFRNVHLGIVTPIANERGTAEKFVAEAWEECRAFSLSRSHAITSCSTGPAMTALSMFERPAGEVPSPRPHLCAGEPRHRRCLSAWLSRSARARGRLDPRNRCWFQPCTRRDSPVADVMAQGYDCVFGSRFLQGVAECLMHRWDDGLPVWVGTILSNMLLGTCSLQ